MQLSAEQQKAIDEQKASCPFCKIVAGEIKAYKVYEDPDFIGVLDINPGMQGHTLLVPREHYPIMPLMPLPAQQRLATVLGELSSALKRAMVVPAVETFIANGAVAGQQSSHCLVHLLPSEGELFYLPEGESELRSKLEALFVRKPAAPREDLTAVISQNPELKRMIIDQPEELIKNLPTAPDLAKLFAGVDIMTLSTRLRESEGDRAARMTDTALIAFINGKEKLRELLIDDPAALEEAISAQPKLQQFFDGTTVPAVRERYLRGADNV